ncbi:MAG: FemAB family PEP-CTERM system-associated protein [Burkholderiaceae bacterium]|nr:FemAB family PEP-CTERM system-associated protein [Burkholderiaceae bacterium]
MDIEIRQVRDTDVAEWEALVGGISASTFFHRFGWRGLLRAELGFEDRYLCALRNGRIVGLLPLMHVRSRLFGHSLTSLPFCSYAGPLASDASVEDALVESAVRLGIELDVERVELRGLRPLRCSAPRQDLYYTFRAPIPQRLESMKDLPQKRRNVVRRAVSLGLKAMVGRDADRFFELYAENARAHGTPALRRRFFRALLEAFPDDSDILFVTDASGKDISAILSFYHAGEVLAYFAGEMQAARETNANDFKYWSLMMHAASRGCTGFDFGRSKAGTGSFQFKRLWGFEPQPLHYAFPYLPKGIVPENNPLNPRFRLAIEVWRRLPRAVVDRLGPLLVTGLG